MTNENEQNSSPYIPYSIYVKGFPLENCGWNGAYYYQFDKTNKIDTWVLSETEMFCGLLLLRKTAIFQIKDKWVICTMDNNSIVAKGITDDDRMGKMAGPKKTPFDQYTNGIYVDEEFLPPHEYMWFCTKFIFLFLLFCAFWIFITYILFQKEILQIHLK